MRKTFLHLLLLPLAVALLAGCDSAITPIAETSSFEEVLRLQGRQQQVAFGLLSPAERALAWASRLSRIEAFEFASANKSDEQSRRFELFEEYRRLVTNPDNHENERSEEETADIEAQLLDWQERAEEVYDGEELYGLLFTLSTDSSLVSDAPSKTDRLRRCTGCCCSVGSSMTCPKITLSLAGPTIEYGECDYGLNCLSSDRQRCGAAFLFDCDGAFCEF